MSMLEISRESGYPRRMRSARGINTASALSLAVLFAAGLKPASAAVGGEAYCDRIPTVNNPPLLIVRQPELRHSYDMENWAATTDKKDLELGGVLYFTSGGGIKVPGSSWAISWSNDRGGRGVIADDEKWSVRIPLAPGDNSITLKAVNSTLGLSCRAGGRIAITYNPRLAFASSAKAAPDNIYTNENATVEFSVAIAENPRLRPGGVTLHRVGDDGKLGPALAALHRTGGALYASEFVFNEKTEGSLRFRIAAETAENGIKTTAMTEVMKVDVFHHITPQEWAVQQQFAQEVGKQMSAPTESNVQRLRDWIKKNGSDLLGGFSVDDKLQQVVLFFKGGGGTIVSPGPSSTKNELSSPRVYGVEEALRVLDATPDALKGKDILLRATVVDGVSGLGCDDADILTDRRYEESYKARSKVPVLWTASNMADYQKIRHEAVYRGHFFDAGLNACPDGWKRFVIEEMTQEFPRDLSSSKFHREETVNSGALLYEGRLIKPPYRIVMDRGRILINGNSFPQSEASYQTDDQVFAAQERWFNLYANKLKGNNIYVYWTWSRGNLSGGQSCQAPACADVLGKIDRVAASAEPAQEKNAELIKILGLPSSDVGFQCAGGVLENWKPLKPGAKPAAEAPVDGSGVVPLLR